MLEPIAPDLWSATHPFTVSGVALTSRMTVVRLPGGRLWLHSPVPIGAALRAQLDALGSVHYIVAPSKVHHLFMGECAAAFPGAQLFGAPGLARKRPDLVGLTKLEEGVDAGWGPELSFTLFEGIPLANETVWFHAPSATLVLTDLCQWWQGPLPFAARAFATLTGVRQRLDVARTVRLAVKDKAAAHRSAQRVLQWPFDRVVVAHNSIVPTGGHAEVARAFGRFAPQ
jgi:hypothetical protein